MPFLELNDPIAQAVGIKFVGVKKIGTGYGGFDNTPIMFEGSEEEVKALKEEIKRANDKDVDKINHS